MFKTIGNMMRVPELRQKILFTLGVLIVFRLGTFIPVPNVDASIFQTQDAMGVFGVLNTFGGGALENFSIFAMGISPYITASIIIQLLQMDIIPKFSEWAKQGEVGRKKLAQATRYFTIILGFIQASFMAVGFNNMLGGLLIADGGIASYAFIALVLTAGSAFLMWLGEQITAKGIGNGISMIIFAGIVSTIPGTAAQIYAQRLQGAGDELFIGIVQVALVVVAIIAVMVFAIWMQQATRKIPIQYAKKQAAGGKTIGGQNTHLPLKINAAGVIPVIFAMSFLVTPQTVAQFWQGNSVADWIVANVNHSHPVGMAVYIALIIAFSYFYSFIQVNPEKMAENLQKQGGYVPGVRPGKNTQEYVTKVLYRLTFVGSIFLAVIAILPVIFIQFANLPQQAQIGGTSMLIVVGVGLELMKQLESQLVKRHYKGFIK